ncbi:hypothetical protein [Oenococcus sp.]|uniref:hypothetical protein n=1 Tax=Oenococcus sp. TaxID=1979414 RepID=UPI0039E82BA3
MLKKHAFDLMILILIAFIAAGCLSISFFQSGLVSDLQRSTFWYCRSSKYSTIAKAHFDDDFVNLTYREQHRGFFYRDFDAMHYYISDVSGDNLIYFKRLFSKKLLKFKVSKLDSSFKLLPENRLARKTEGVIVLFK